MNIALKEIQKSYRGRQVLRDVSLEAQSGQCIGILGANGSGKSTLLSILAGVLSPQGGQFLADGKDLLGNSGLLARYVGYVPQGTPLLEELTARDNLLLWYSPQELETELSSGVLKSLGIGSFLKMPVRKLSGGMKKRLSIGCAVAKRPPVLLLDEPTAALDLAGKEQIATYLRRYCRAGGLVLLATHDVQEIALCDALYILKSGVLEPYTFTGDVAHLVERL